MDEKKEMQSQVSAKMLELLSTLIERVKNKEATAAETALLAAVADSILSRPIWFS